MRNTDSYHSAEDAHNLVEEYMILANYLIASFLLDRYPNCVPLRTQEEPSAKMVREWVESYPVIGKFVLGIQHLPLTDTSNFDVCKMRSLKWNQIFPVQLHVWKKMTSDVTKTNFKEVQQVVGTDAIHPQQALALEPWMAFQESAKYICSGYLKRKSDFTFL
jgi:hypothetical protein